MTESQRGRRSQWPNPEMWREAARHRRGGWTLPQIQGWLSRKEVSDRFGLKELPSTDTIGRRVRQILTADDAALSDRRVSVGQPGDAVRDHLVRLRERLLSLSGLSTVSIPNTDLLSWHSRRDEAWPIAQGSIRILADLAVEVRLTMEADPAWPMLNEHLPGHALWNTITEWKAAMCQDLSSRLLLLDAIVEWIESPEGLGVPVLRALDREPTNAAVSVDFAFTVYQQSLAGAMRSNHVVANGSSFGRDPAGRITLGGTPIVRAGEDAVAQRAQEFLIASRGADQVSPLARTVADNVRVAEEKTQSLKRDIEAFGLGPGFPRSTACYACQEWFDPESS